MATRLIEVRLAALGGWDAGGLRGQPLSQVQSLMRPEPLTPPPAPPPMPPPPDHPPPPDPPPGSHTSPSGFVGVNLVGDKDGRDTAQPYEAMARGVTSHSMTSLGRFASAEAAHICVCVVGVVCVCDVCVLCVVCVCTSRGSSCLQP